MSGSKASYLKRVFAIKRKFDLRYGGFRLARACIRHDARGSDDADLLPLSDLEADVHADQRQKEAKAADHHLKCFAPDMP